MTRISIRFNWDSNAAIKGNKGDPRYCGETELANYRVTPSVLV
jgi:hypothetical protein